PKRRAAGDIDEVVYLPLADALARRYPIDAHTSQYSVPAIPRRLGGNEEREGSGQTLWERIPACGISMVAFFIDVEPALHAAPTRAGYTVDGEKLRALLCRHPGGFVYTTRGGYRVVFKIEPRAIRSPVDAAQWSLAYTAWIEYLAV